jgi:hypothetical protein
MAMSAKTQLGSILTYQFIQYLTASWFEAQKVPHSRSCFLPSHLYTSGSNCLSLVFFPSRP